MSGDGFRRRPIFAAGFRGRATRWHGPVPLGCGPWSVRQELNLRPSGPKPDALPGCATHGRKTKEACPRFHFGCVLTRRAARWARPRQTSLHRSDQLMHIPPDRRRGNFWRWGEGTPEMESGKTKRPGTLRCPGLFARELERCAPTRDLHPGAPDEPRTDHPRADGLRLGWRTRCSDAKTTTGATACRNHGRTRRARAVGPRRVECW